MLQRSEGGISFTDRQETSLKMNLTGTGVRAFAWEYEVFILLLNSDIKHIRFSGRKRVAGRAENDSKYGGDTALPESCQPRV